MRESAMNTRRTIRDVRVKDSSTKDTPSALGSSHRVASSKADISFANWLDHLTLLDLPVVAYDDAEASDRDDWTTEEEDADENGESSLKKEGATQPGTPVDVVEKTLSVTPSPVSSDAEYAKAKKPEGEEPSSTPEISNQHARQRGSFDGGLSSGEDAHGTPVRRRHRREGVSSDTASSVRNEATSIEEDTTKTRYEDDSPPAQRSPPRSTFDRSSARLEANDDKLFEARSHPTTHDSDSPLDRSRSFLPREVSQLIDQEEPRTPPKLNRGRPRASSGGSPSLVHGTKDRCWHRFWPDRDRQCTRKPCLSALAYLREDDDTIGGYCEKHGLDILLATSFDAYYPREPLRYKVEYDAWIPAYLSAATQVLLRRTMEGKPWHSDGPGYIYVFQMPRTAWQPRAFEVGSTAEWDVGARLETRRERCGERVIFRGMWPPAGTHWRAMRETTSIQPSRFHLKLERLIHLELADLSLYDTHLTPQFSPPFEYPQQLLVTMADGMPPARAQSSPSKYRLEDPERKMSNGRSPPAKKPERMKCPTCGEHHDEVFRFARRANGMEWKDVVWRVVEKWGRFMDLAYGGEQGLR